MIGKALALIAVVTPLVARPSSAKTTPAEPAPLVITRLDSNPTEPNALKPVTVLPSSFKSLRIRCSNSLVRWNRPIAGLGNPRGCSISSCASATRQRAKLRPSPVASPGVCGQCCPRCAVGRRSTRGGGWTDLQLW